VRPFPTFWLQVAVIGVLGILVYISTTLSLEHPSVSLEVPKFLLRSTPAKEFDAFQNPKASNDIT
jgi:hypothetical protein